MPVAWVYLTGWVTRDGTVQFREDVYKHDEALDRNALAEAAAGGLCARCRREEAGVRTSTAGEGDALRNRSRITM